MTSIRVVETVAAMRDLSRAWRLAGESIGFVPTMGALHEGHASLARRARGENRRVLASVFVNPTQFAPGEDFEKYPRTWEADLAICEREGVDCVFRPPAAEIYPPGFGTYVDPGPLGDLLCGASRPGHFRGVLTVVARLFGVVAPDRAYFGVKDFQQAVLVRRMAVDLAMGVDCVLCATVREPDGLARSSRNRYLSADERARAAVLRRALIAARDLARGGERSGPRLAEAIRAVIAGVRGVEIEYAEVVHPATLRAVEDLSCGAVALLACRVGATRLIDNEILRDLPGRPAC